MRIRERYRLLLVFISAFSMSLLISCMPAPELNSSTLPVGFDDSNTFIHSANLGLYIGSDAPINSFLQIDEGIPLESMELRAKLIPTDLAIRLKFRELKEQEFSGLAEDIFGKFYGDSIVIDNQHNQIMLINNESQWSRQASKLWMTAVMGKSAIAPELRELLSFLPQNPSSEIQAVGYVRNVDTLYGDVFSHVSNSLRAVDGFLNFLRSNLVIAAGYGEINATDWQKLRNNQNFTGIIALARSSYPGFLSEIICDQFFQNFSFEHLNTNGHKWHILDIREDSHIMTKCQEDLIYLVLTPNLDKAMTLAKVIDLDS